MEFELQYLKSRAIEEREAAWATSCSEARERHIKLAKAFQLQAEKIERSPA